MRRFSEPQRRLLLSIGRSALTFCLAHGLSPADAAGAALDAARPQTAGGPLAPGKPALDAPLLDNAACFVTLWWGEERRLRGCRGEFTAHQPLADAVAHMALAAALDDPRFPRLALAELPHVRIEISVLSPPAPINPSEIELGRHGLLLMYGRHRALLLPEVPVEHHFSPEEYLAALCDKAGLPPDAWRDAQASLWAFETEAWEEESVAPSERRP